MKRLRLCQHFSALTKRAHGTIAWHAPFRPAPLHHSAAVGLRRCRPPLLRSACRWWLRCIVAKRGGGVVQPDWFCWLRRCVAERLPRCALYCGTLWRASPRDAGAAMEPRRARAAFCGGAARRGFPRGGDHARGQWHVGLFRWRRRNCFISKPIRRGCGCKRQRDGRGPLQPPHPQSHAHGRGVHARGERGRRVRQWRWRQRFLQ